VFKYHHQLLQEDAYKPEKGQVMSKIKYTLNQLPGTRDELSTITEIIGNTDNLEIFETEAIKGIINFKWNKFGKQLHYTCAIIHFIYVIMFMVYVDSVYLKQEYGLISLYLFVMFCCHVYAFLYDGQQLCR